MSDRYKRREDIYDIQRERHLRKEHKKRVREIREDFPDDVELDELVKKYPTPKEWYDE